MGDGRNRNRDTPGRCSEIQSRLIKHEEMNFYFSVFYHLIEILFDQSDVSRETKLTMH